MKVDRVRNKGVVREEVRNKGVVRDEVRNKGDVREEVSPEQTGSEPSQRNQNAPLHQSDYELTYLPESVEQFETPELSVSLGHSKTRGSVDISRPAVESVGQRSEPEGGQRRNLVVLHARNTVITQNPDFELTFEEDFKIHEFLVRKENVFDSILSLLERHPSFEEKFTKFIMSCNEKSMPPAQAIESLSVEEDQFTAAMVLQDIDSGGIIRQSLDMFDEHKQVDPGIKTESFMFTICVGVLCNRWGQF